MHGHRNIIFGTFSNNLYFALIQPFNNKKPLNNCFIAFLKVTIKTGGKQIQNYILNLLDKKQPVDRLLP